DGAPTAGLNSPASHLHASRPGAKQAEPVRVITSSHVARSPPSVSAQTKFSYDNLVTIVCIPDTGPRAAPLSMPGAQPVTKAASNRFGGILARRCRPGRRVRRRSGDDRPAQGRRAFSNRLLAWPAQRARNAAGPAG